MNLFNILFSKMFKLKFRLVVYCNLLHFEVC